MHKWIGGMQRGFLTLAIVALSTTARAESPQLAGVPSAATKNSKPGMFNLPLKTSGGLQCWGDELVYSGWRIQRNCFTGHCRLLDRADYRQAWGSYDDCHAAFAAALQSQKIPPTRGHVVIALHGLAGMRPMMSSLCTYLREKGNYTVLDVCYPSTRVDIDEDAAALGRIIDGLPEADEIDFVAHSLGNIVVRRYLALHTDPSKNLKPDPRIKRFVMLAPPNHGAPQAEVLVSLDFTGQVVGPAAKELTKQWKQLEPKLVTPACEFAVLAGGLGDDKGYNFLIPGDDDGVVAVSSAKLAGARDFRLLPAMHIRFMKNELVQQYALHFLKDGNFESDDKRTPL